MIDFKGLDGGFKKIIELNFPMSCHKMIKNTRGVEF